MREKQPSYNFSIARMSPRPIFSKRRINSCVFTAFPLSTQNALFRLYSAKHDLSTPWTIYAAGAVGAVYEKAQGPLRHIPRKKIKRKRIISYTFPLTNCPALSCGCIFSYRIKQPECAIVTQRDNSKIQIIFAAFKAWLYMKATVIIATNSSHKNLYSTNLSYCCWQ